jgi:hypothetical protein
VTTINYSETKCLPVSRPSRLEINTHGRRNLQPVSDTELTQTEVTQKCVRPFVFIQEAEQQLSLAAMLLTTIRKVPVSVKTSVFSWPVIRNLSQALHRDRIG